MSRDDLSALVTKLKDLGQIEIRCTLVQRQPILETTNAVMSGKSAKTGSFPKAQPSPLPPARERAVIPEKAIKGRALSYRAG